MITQAFILGAGLGTRLRPLTDQLPKPLIPIFQKPLITFAFDHLIAAGCTKLVVNTHRDHERFAETFPKSNYRRRHITFFNEPEILGTGGGIKNAESGLAVEPFVVYSGDLLTDFALAPLLEEHLRAGNEVTMALRETPFSPSVSVRSGRVVDIAGKYGHAGDYDFANVSVWNPEAVAGIPAGRAMSFIPILTDAIGKGRKIGGVVVNDGKWFNIGSRIEYLAVHRTILEQRWIPQYVTDSDWPIQIAADAKVASSARMAGCCAIGAGACVGENAVLEDTIVWPGAQIASRSRLRNCIVRSHSVADGEFNDLDL